MKRHLMLVGILLLGGCAHTLKVQATTGSHLNALGDMRPLAVKVGMWALRKAPPGLTAARCEDFATPESVTALLGDVMTSAIPVEHWSPDDTPRTRFRVTADTHWVMLVPFYQDRCDPPASQRPGDVDLWAMTPVGPLRRKLYFDLDDYRVRLPWRRHTRQRGCVEGRGGQHLPDVACEPPTLVLP
jgi:hypothetical protein